MPITYNLPDQETLVLLDDVMKQHHARLEDHDVRIGILMAHAAVDEKTGRRKGNAIKGYAGAGAAAQVKKVPLRDRITKKYDVELLLDGDTWPLTPEPTKAAILDHEMTHILPQGERDDLGRPVVKMRDEDFIVWGFLEVVERHGAAAIEARSVKALIDEHGQLLLKGISESNRPGPSLKQIGKDFVKSMKDTVGPGGSVTITAGDHTTTIHGDPA